jgi:Mg2+/Co2+ transporter CorC
MMLEGVIRMAGMTAGDVMVPSRHMDLLDIDAPTTTSSTSSSAPAIRAFPSMRSGATTSSAS